MRRRRQPYPSLLTDYQGGKALKWPPVMQLQSRLPAASNASTLSGGNLILQQRWQRV